VGIVGGVGDMDGAGVGEGVLKQNTNLSGIRQV